MADDKKNKPPLPEQKSEEKPEEKPEHVVVNIDVPGPSSPRPLLPPVGNKSQKTVTGGRGKFIAARPGLHLNLPSENLGTVRVPISSRPPTKSPTKHLIKGPPPAKTPTVGPKDALLTKTPVGPKDTPATKTSIVGSKDTPATKTSTGELKDAPPTKGSMEPKDTPATKTPIVGSKDTPATKTPIVGSKDTPATKTPIVGSKDTPATKAPTGELKDAPATKSPMEPKDTPPTKSPIGPKVAPPTKSHVEPKGTPATKTLPGPLIKDPSPTTEPRSENPKVDGILSKRISGSVVPSSSRHFRIIAPSPTSVSAITKPDSNLQNEESDTTGKSTGAHHRRHHHRHHHRQPKLSEVTIDTPHKDALAPTNQWTFPSLSSAADATKGSVEPPQIITSTVTTTTTTTDNPIGKPAKKSIFNKLQSSNDRKVHPDKPTEEKESSEGQVVIKKVVTRKITQRKRVLKPKLANESPDLDIIDPGTLDLQKSKATETPIPLKSDSGIGGRHKRPKKRKKIPGDVYRIRDGENFYKFRKVGTVEEVLSDPMDDPLLVENIQGADNYISWKREAQMALPSNIGVPVEDADDVVKMGISVQEQRAGGHFNRKSAFNEMYDEMGKKYSMDLNETDTERNRKKPRTGLRSSFRNSLKLTNPSSHPRKSSDKGPITFRKKLKSVREMTENMGEKRRQKQELLKQGLEDVTEQQRTLKDTLELVVVKVHNTVRDMSRLFTLWRHDVNTIHGRYGIGAATYFHWLRIVVGLNIIQTILVLLLLVIPEQFSDSSNKHVMLTSCHTKVYHADTCSIIPSIKRKAQFSWIDLITGSGTLRHSSLYYSGYKDSLADPFCPAHKLIEHPKWFIQVTAFRFALIIFLMFLINTIYLAVQVKNYYETAELESKIPGLHHKTVYRSFFSLWDFSVTDPETASVLHRNIWRGFKDAEDKSVSSKKAVQAQRPYLEKKLESYLSYDKAVIAVHILMSILLLMIYFVAGYFMWLSLHSRLIWKQNRKNQNPCNEFLSIPNILLLLPSFVMTALYIGVGYLSAFIAQFESWGSQVSKNFAFIARVGLYYFMTIVIIYGFFLLQARESITELLCYEDFFGHEMYRLIVLQGFLYLTISFVGYNIYDYFQQRYQTINKPQFDPVNYTMRVFYLHTLAGIGFFYCPLAGFLVVIRLVLTFYHHKRMLKKFYRLSTHVIQSSDIRHPFLVAYLVSYLTTTLINLALFEFHPSTVCGPFSHYNEEDPDNYAHYYQMFVDGFKSSKNFFIKLLISPGFAFVLVVFLIALMYTVRQWSFGYLHTIEQLYRLLQLERKDRDFLLEAIYHFAKRESEKIEQNIRDDASGIVSSPNGTDDMFEGIFIHRKGTLAAIMPLTRSAGGKDHSKDDADLEEHGTVGKFLKQDFDWLPSQWTRRRRRSASTVGFSKVQLSNLQELHSASLVADITENLVDDKHKNM